MRTWSRVLATALVLLPAAGVACGTVGTEEGVDAPEDVSVQRHALGPGNSCFSYCGGVTPSGCSCASTCTGGGNCCADYAAQCVNGGSCAGNCTSGDASGGACACDEACALRGDCCADYTTVCPGCGVLTRTWGPTLTVQPPPPGTFVPLAPHTDPRVGVDANGDAVVIWKFEEPFPSTVKGVRVRRHTGGSWTPRKTLVPGVNASPSLEVGSSGDAFATFGAEEWVFTPGTGWSSAALTSTPASSAVDGAGNKMLLFLAGTSLEARLLTAGGVLKPAHPLSSSATLFDVASNAAGDFAVVYNDGPKLMLAVKYPSVAWASVQIATSGTAPRVGLDANRRAMVAWIDGTSVKAVRVNGTTPGSTATVASSTQAMSELRLATNASGRSIATWKRGLASTTDLRIAAAVFYAPTGWSAPTQVAQVAYSPETGGAGRPGIHDVGIDDCGAGFIVFEDMPYTVLAARYTPLSGWNTPIVLTSGKEREPRLATAPNGITTVVWDGEFEDVYAARFE